MFSETLEHDGGEFFDEKNITNRVDAQKVEDRQEELNQKMTEAELEQQQEVWLSIDNPFLWTEF